MAVLILLILLDLLVVVLIMWAVKTEPHRQLKGNHPFVLAEREAAKQAPSVPDAPEATPPAS